jgi:RimJ/RimL family protein N-acetyltransferase
VPDLVFATQRLDVRPWTHDDVDRMYDIYRRQEVSRWLGTTGRPTESVDAMHATIDRWAVRSAVAPYGIWAVVPREGGVPAGTVLLVPFTDADGADLADIEVGWHFHPDAWGNGYATESARGALELAWAAGLTEVYAVVHPGNDRSVAVTRRLGMSALGRTDRFYGLELDAFLATAPSAARLG